MKPFRIIYIIYIIISVVANAYYTIVYNKFIDDDEKFKKYCDYLSSESLESIDGFKDGSYNCDSLRSDLKTTEKISIVVAVILFFIDIVHYITTNNYIKSVEKEEKEYNNFRNIENAY